MPISLRTPEFYQGLEVGDHELSEDLFICIQSYMTCTMDPIGQTCMRDYNKCTLNVLDSYHSEKVSNEIVQESTEENDELLEDDDDYYYSSEENISFPKPSTDACNGFNVPKTYGSFSGRRASNTGKDTI